MDILHAFYTSKAWRELSFKLKIERGGKCERTGEIFADMSQLIAHHKTELTEENVNDHYIALNPENIEIISFDEHNKEHRRFGNAKRVFIVWGSPRAGKSTMVRDMIRYGDIVLDIDRLWEAVTMQPMHTKPDNVRFNIFALRDSMMDQIKTRYGQWYDAYIIGGYADKYERERLSQTLGAELIHCDASKQDCIDRCKGDARYINYVNTWWDTYERIGTKHG